jgi:NADH:ubiquinone oxidoreductase subunit E
MFHPKLRIRRLCFAAVCFRAGSQGVFRRLGHASGHPNGKHVNDDEMSLSLRNCSANSGQVAMGTPAAMASRVDPQPQ